MAIAIIVPGYSTCKIQTVNGSLSSLGICRNEPEVALEPYWYPIFSDDNGGEQGPATEFQLLGITATIRLRLSKFDVANANLLDAFISDATAGQPAAAGDLLFTGNNYFRLLLYNANYPINFPMTQLVGPSDRAYGTKAQERVLEFKAFKNAAGVLFNSSTS